MVQPIIWVEGIIGVGKTTFAEELGKQLDFHVLQEPVNDNLLKIYYEDQIRWGFSFQIDMLLKRLKIHFEAVKEREYGRGVIIDRGLPGDRVFAQMLMREGKIHPIEWNIYEEAYNSVIQMITPPDVLIYLDVSPEVAYKRIQSRNREAEVNDLVPLPYLQHLYSEYRELLYQFYTGFHAWSSKTEVWEVDWNEDWLSTEYIVNNIGIFTRILNFFKYKVTFPSSKELHHLKVEL